MLKPIILSTVLLSSISIASEIFLFQTVEENYNTIKEHATLLETAISEYDGRLTVKSEIDDPDFEWQISLVEAGLLDEKLSYSIDDDYPLEWVYYEDEQLLLLSNVDESICKNLSIYNESDFDSIDSFLAATGDNKEGCGYVSSDALSFDFYLYFFKLDLLEN
jgi:hypothetical protein